MGKWRKVASGEGTRTSRRSWDTHLTQIHSKLVNLMNMTLPTKLKKVTGNKTFATKSAPDEENHRQVDTTTMVISKTVLDLTPSFDPCEGSAKGNNGSDMESSVQWVTAMGGSEETLVVGFKMDRVERAILGKLVVFEEDLGKHKSVEEANLDMLERMLNQLLLLVEINMLEMMLSRLLLLGECFSTIAAFLPAMAGIYKTGPSIYLTQYYVQISWLAPCNC